MTQLNLIELDKKKINKAEFNVNHFTPLHTPDMNHHLL